MEEADKTLNDLLKFIEQLSLHQRLLGHKIEELDAHHRQFFQQQNRIYDQIDSLFSIFSLITIRHPLPTMRGWPVSPDFVKLLMSLVLERKPNKVVELGSGISTLVTAYCLEKNGQGRLWSFDHDQTFAQMTAKNLQNHGLEHWAEVQFSALAKGMFGLKESLWYTLSPEQIPEVIDLLVVDGPPATIERDIRYPAIPFFYKRLSADAVVLLDDAARPGEKAIVERWLAEYPHFVREYLDTEKGTVILRKP